jgi:hypothetical protein
MYYLGRCGGTSTPCRANPWQQAPETAAAGCNPAPPKPTRFSKAASSTKQRKHFRIRCIRTRGGKQSSAARRGTENPPCVLVSDAVSVLQNMWGIRAKRCLTVSRSSASPPLPSSDPPRSRVAISCKHQKRATEKKNNISTGKERSNVAGAAYYHPRTSLSATSASCAYTSSVAASACKNRTAKGSQV